MLTYDFIDFFLFGSLTILFFSHPKFTAFSSPNIIKPHRPHGSKALQSLNLKRISRKCATIKIQLASTPPINECFAAAGDDLKSNRIVWPATQLCRCRLLWWTTGVVLEIVSSTRSHARNLFSNQRFDSYHAFTYDRRNLGGSECELAVFV